MPLLIGSIAILFFVPWLDTSQRALDQLPADLQMVLLGVRGDLRLRLAISARSRRKAVYLVLGRILTAYYFAVLPGGHAGGRVDREAEGRLPGSITESVLGPRGNGARRTQQSPRLRKAPRAGAGVMTSSSPISALRCMSRAASLLALSRSAPRFAEDASASDRAGNHEPEIDAQSWSFIGAVRHLSTTPSSSAASRSTRKSARTAIRCGSCPTAISASPAGRNSRRRRSTTLACAGAGDRRAERQGRDVPAPGTAVRPFPLALRQRAAGARTPMAARCRRISR